ncbi:MAG: hypothetical protein WCI11_20315 [Candidatus Methylumidiphilus sp.]
MDTKERCPFCESENINKFNSNVIEHEFACRSCKKQWKKTHAGGQVLKAGGAILTGVGAFALWLLSAGGDGDGGAA